jgi:glycosyltransferase involved in cell wall biosynthesis
MNFELSQGRLVVCVITRGRAASLFRLLDALERLPSPPDVDVAVVIVENDNSATMRDEVQRRSRPDRRFVHGLQPALGIPFARNAALRMALDAQASYVAFIDDDEVPTDNWLLVLWEKACSGRYDLVGGPVEPVAVEPPRTWTEQQLLAGLQAQAADSRRKASLRCSQGREAEQFVATSNWMARGDFIRQHGLAFDESMGFSGGTDLKFYRELRRAGGRVGWCDAAVVQEGLAPGRLTLGYQYRRARDQAVSNFGVRYAQVRGVLVVRGLAYCAGKMLRAVGWLMLLPVFRGTALVQSTRSAGQAVGRWRALRGSRSDHYRSVV